MKTAGTIVLALGLFNLALLLTILYWFVFTNGYPPFIQGRPMEDVAFPLALLGGCCGFFGAMMRSLA